MIFPKLFLNIPYQNCFEKIHLKDRLQCGHKLKHCANLRLHDESYTSFAVSLLVHKMGGGGKGGERLFEGSVYFKFRPIGGALIRGRGMLIRVFIV